MITGTGSTSLRKQDLVDGRIQSVGVLQIASGTFGNYVWGTSNPKNGPITVGDVITFTSSAEVTGWSATLL